MNSKLPAKQRNGIFYKIFLKIKQIFRRKKYEEENYKYENICDKIYPWVKTELTDSHALNGKHFSKKDAPVISFLGDLNVVFAI